MVYEKMSETLGGRSSKKVANNTYLQRRDADTIALHYHATDVVIYHSDGRIVLESGGWRTVTTKVRWNADYAGLSREGFRVASDKGVLYLYKWTEPREEWPFEDGITLRPNGDGRYHVDVDTIGEDPKKTQKTRRKVKEYASKFIAELRAGNVPSPSAGDCFYCAMRVQGTNVPLGEQSKDKTHIESHIAERYYVPSLLVRACEVMPCSQAMKWAIGETWTAQAKTDAQTTFEKIDPYWSKQDFIWQSLAKMLAKYILRQLGEVS